MFPEPVQAPAASIGSRGETDMECERGIQDVSENTDTFILIIEGNYGT